jgi:hypothetical protein
MIDLIQPCSLRTSEEGERYNSLRHAAKPGVADRSGSSNGVVAFI